MGPFVPVDGHPLLLHPTWSGKSRTLPDPENIVFNNAGWLDANHVIAFGKRSESARKATFRTSLVVRHGALHRRRDRQRADVVDAAISPDGTRVVARGRTR
jgi:hypothetical protein